MEEEWYQVKGADAEDDVGEATSSVHALEGSFGVETIRILGFHKNRQLVTIIDSGNTTSFLYKKATWR